MASTWISYGASPVSSARIRLVPRLAMSKWRMEDRQAELGTVKDDTIVVPMCRNSPPSTTCISERGFWSREGIDAVLSDLHSSPSRETTSAD